MAEKQKSLTGTVVSDKMEKTVVVRVDQPLGRLAFFLLEPRSDDGLLNWNFFDDALQRDGRYCPVLRTTAAF